MSAILNSFKQFLIEIKGDMMLAVMSIAPILMGLVFRFVLPFSETVLSRYFEVSKILAPYYLIFDLILVYMTPMMFSFCAVMVMFEEIDTGISSYMMVTPLGKKGYLISRIGIPAIISFIYDIVIIMVFSLTGVSLVMGLCLSILSSINGVITSLLVVSIATNKVECMAMTKLSGLLMLGLPVPFFVEGWVQYITVILPSYWYSKFAISQNYVFCLLSILVSFIWIGILYRKFEKKLFK